MPTISAKPDGVGGAYQLWIPRGEQSGSLTHTAMTEGVLLSAPTKYSARLLNLKRGWNLACANNVRADEKLTAFVELERAIYEVAVDLIS
jgi:hypothetical protein